ncbi:hypothetical protein CS369_16665 [Candidatus Symbiopectobacterium sp. 'North America']|uniref:hypothetical protein n=1 Tax=Candidatus Symbiopectobacterium sp. 'North America' TaxID=2794574 RepID=UPI0018C96EB2|nr:hypothetical protein [Candidatus Symbiopectobacterium sp. 'North America']MBG6245984.1 hypothetical protein [Candidatus Symbiopectobacterium sp. 'North America']
MNVTSINDTPHYYRQADNCINVEMGSVGCATDRMSVLHTECLTYCCALAVLSKWNGRWYQQRTLLHIIGGYLFCGIRSESDRRTDLASRWIAKLKSELADGGKIIFVGGINSSSDMAFSLSIHQTDDEGHKPLTLPGTDITMAGALGLTIHPNGEVVFDVAGSRGELNQQECFSILREEI